MEITKFIKLDVKVENGSTSDVHVEASVNEYFWLDNTRYEHDLDTTLCKKVREALRMVGNVRMVDIELYRSSTAFRADNELIDHYRIVERGYPHELRIGHHNGHTGGVVFDFDNAPVVEIKDICSYVKRLQKQGFELYKKERVLTEE